MDVKIFEKTENTDPNQSQRIAFGRAGYDTENMTLTNFIAWCLSYLGFLKVTNNLSDLNNVGTARTNLSVYSIAQITSFLSAKQNTITATGWHDGTRVSSDVELASFICKANQWGNVVSGNGRIKFTGDPGNDVLFTLPIQVTPPTIDIPFGSTDGTAGSSPSECTEMYIASGTRNVYAYDHSIGSVNSFNFTYIV